MGITCVPINTNNEQENNAINNNKGADGNDGLMHVQHISNVNNDISILNASLSGIAFGLGVAGVFGWYLLRRDQKRSSRAAEAFRQLNRTEHDDDDFGYEDDVSSSSSFEQLQKSVNSHTSSYQREFGGKGQRKEISKRNIDSFNGGLNLENTFEMVSPSLTYNEQSVSDRNSSCPYDESEETSCFADSRINMGTVNSIDDWSYTGSDYLGDGNINLHKDSTTYFDANTNSQQNHAAFLLMDEHDYQNSGMDEFKQDHVISIENSNDTMNDHYPMGLNHTFPLEEGIIVMNSTSYDDQMITNTSSDKQLHHNMMPSHNIEIYETCNNHSSSSLSPRYLDTDDDVDVDDIADTQLMNTTTTLSTMQQQQPHYGGGVNHEELVLRTQHSIAAAKSKNGC